MGLPILNTILSAGQNLTRNLSSGYRRGAELVEARNNNSGINSQTGLPSRAGKPSGSIFNPSFYSSLAAGAPSRPGYETVVDPISKLTRKKSVILPSSPSITPLKNPAQFLGAFVPNLTTDLATNASRGLMWLYNHPVPVIDKAVKTVVGEDVLKNYNATQKGLIGLAAITPAVASMGTFDIFNPGEAFRPKGYAQEYSEEGVDDRRKTEQPVQETIQRLIMGRQGSTLKFETAQEDIPELTKDRYDKYQMFRYNDKGLLDLGVLKATGENLQGVPEARWFGFPVNIPTATAVVGGIAGYRTLKNKVPGEISTSNAVARVGGAAMAGAMLGNFVNEIIATANRPKLPDLKSYEQQYSIAPVDYSQRGIG